MKPGDNIEESVRKLRHTTSAETDERILSDALAELQESIQSRRPTAMKSTIAALAALAVIIIAVFIGVKVFTAPAPKQPLSLIQKQAPAPEAAVETARESEQDLGVEPGAEPAEEKLQAELREIKGLFAAGDIDGLALMLLDKPLASWLAAAVYLAEIGDSQALEALEELSSTLGGDDPNNLFAIAAAELWSKIEQEEGKPVFAEDDKLKSEPAGLVRTIDEKSYIYGLLIDANGDPVRGEIKLGVSRAEADSNGAFTIREPADYTKFGLVFGRTFDANGNLGRFFVWDRDNDANNFQIIVEPLARVSGVVVDSDNNTISDFRLKISVFETEDVVYQGSIDGEPWKTQVSADGSFVINSIPTGVRLQLAVNKPGFKTLINLDGLVAGGNFDLGRIALEPMPGFSEETQWNCSVFGFIVDENNEPLPRAGISLTAGEEIIKGRVDANGWYEFTGLPREVELSIVPYFDGYGNNPFQYSCADVNARLDIQIFPQAYDWYNQTAPALVVRKWLNCEPLTLDSFKGKSVLLCLGLDYQKEKALLKDLNTLQRDFEAVGNMAFVGVHKYIDEGAADEGILRQFIDDENISFPLAIDESMDAAENMILPDSKVVDGQKISIKKRPLTEAGATHSIYEVRAAPSFYLINPDGILITCVHQAQIEDLVADLLGL
jgi:hypothetical protein